MAGTYLKKHATIEFSAAVQSPETSTALHWRPSYSYKVNGHKGNRHGSCPAELSVVELTKLRYARDGQLPQINQGLFSAINESRKSITFQTNNEESSSNNDSWWYMFCLKCRKKEVGPGWEPKRWSSVFPHPYCPSYRHVARILALLTTVLLFWGVVYAVVRDDAAPGGQLFNIAALVVAAYLGGWVFRMLTLPALVGMLFVGMAFKNVGLINVNDHYKEFVTVLRKMALVVIFTRAGLDLDPVALKKLYCRVLVLALLPWCAEAAVISVTVNYLLDMPWKFAVLCGSIMAAVSPAIVVPSLFRLRTKGYGVAKGIPTLIIAVAGIDDAASVIAFGVGTSIIFGASNQQWALNVLASPMSVLGGITYGVVWGLIVKYIPERSDPYVVPLRILMLTASGLLAVLGCEGTIVEGAGPLAVIIAAFTSVYFWSKQGWHIEDNPVATAFEIFWMVFEPILFGMTGTQIVFNNLDLKMVSLIIACVTMAFLSRIIVTIIAASGSSLNFKEKLFVALSWMAKASVQAVLGPAVLDAANKHDSAESTKYGETIVTVCVISILLTAPVGATIVSLGGSKLLTKAKPSSEQWHRRGTRPSIRDITLNSDDEGDGTCVSNDQSDGEKVGKPETPDAQGERI